MHGTSSWAPIKNFVQFRKIKLSGGFSHQNQKSFKPTPKYITCPKRKIFFKFYSLPFYWSIIALPQRTEHSLYFLESIPTIGDSSCAGLPCWKTPCSPCSPVHFSNDYFALCGINPYISQKIFQTNLHNSGSFQIMYASWG